MAKLVIDTCDFCKAFEMVPVEATETVELVWKGKPRRWVVCDPHGHLFHQLDFVIERLDELNDEHVIEVEEDTETHIVEREEPQAQLVKSDAPALEAPGPTEQELKLAELERQIAELQAQQDATSGEEQPAPQPHEEANEIGAPVPEPEESEADLQEQLRELTRRLVARTEAPAPKSGAPKQGELLPSAPAAKRRGIPADGKQRLHCLEKGCGDIMLRSSANGHARMRHGKTLQEAKFEGVGFLWEPPVPNGTKDPNRPSFVCTMPHHGQENSPEEYWVLMRRMGSHARAHGVHPAAIKWKNPDGVEVGARCTEHAECARYDGGLGFPFLNELALTAHVNKTREMAQKQLQEVSA